MKRTIFTALAVTLLLVGCQDTTGLSKDSSRTPRGNPNAAVTVTEFGDIQCPACKAAHESVNAALLTQFGDQIRFDFKHFPLRSIHRYALEAAMASECAADQGKFWQFIDYAYEHQEEMDIDAIEKWGTDLALDTELYKRCWKSQIKKTTVMADYQEGIKLNVSGTPTYFVNGQQVATNQLTQAVQAALDQFNQRL